MKANELRIGNWVYNYKAELCQIKYFQSGESYSNGKKDNDWLCIYSINKSYPILLTEEWMQKLGLIHELSRYDNHWYLRGIDWLGFEFDEEGKKWSCILLSGKRLITQFLYVHELQNIAHSLTGEQL